MSYKRVVIINTVIKVFLIESLWQQFYSESPLNSDYFHSFLGNQSTSRVWHFGLSFQEVVAVEQKDWQWRNEPSHSQRCSSGFCILFDCYWNFHCNSHWQNCICEISKQLKINQISLLGWTYIKHLMFVCLPLQTYYSTKNEETQSFKGKL
jgi:hypothetical protein